MRYKRYETLQDLRRDILFAAAEISPKKKLDSALSAFTTTTTQRPAFRGKCHK